MKAFKYTARSKSGTVVDGIAEANTREEALTHLREDGLIVETIEESGAPRSLSIGFGTRKLKEKELAIICNQFAIILQSGIPIVRAMELVANQSDDKALKRVLTNVADDVAAGYNLADSFAKHGTMLPHTFVESVRAGEASGSLDTTFKRLSKYYEKRSRTKSKVRSAMIYPSFVLVIAVIVIFIIMIFAIPTFASTFERMGSGLPPITQALVSTSNFMVRFWWIIALLVIAAVLGIQAGKRNEAFRMKWSKLGLRIPVIGRINRMSASGQYASTMAIMMGAGLNVVSSVEVTARALSNYFMSQKFASIKPEVEAGKQLSTCMAKLGVFPELVTEMTGVGEQTGALESTLDVLSEYYDNEVEVSTQRALSILEPLLIVVLAFIVLGILLAVYLPMFDIYGGATAAM